MRLAGKGQAGLDEYQVRDCAIALERFATDGTGGPRVYPLEEVAIRANMSLRSILDDCRAGRVEHIHRRDFRGMTAPQIEALIERYIEGGDGTTTTQHHSSAALQGSRRNAQRASRRKAS
jgi:hypothetical protein